MEAARPSRTALRVAMRRAAHQLYDAKPLVLEDPIAVPILGPYIEEVRRTPTRPDRPFSVALRAFLVARSRYAEDKLGHAVASGATQYVLLGAGLDTFAHRNPYPHLHVFEVDHPATQQWKRELLAVSNLPVPEGLTYAPIDFEHQTLPEQLLAAGFDPNARTFFAWLGVVPYLTPLPSARRSTSSRRHPQAAASSWTMGAAAFCVAFPRAASTRLTRFARSTGRGTVPTLLHTGADGRRAGRFSKDYEDIGSQEINARYFAHRTDHLKTRGSSGRLLSAWV